MLSRNTRIGILALIALSAVLALLFVGPIAQDPNYHHFADTRRIAGIGNFWNVASNLPFLLVGIIGLLRCSSLARGETAQCYLVLCIGIVLVSFGSAYYHYAPGNERLLWDRLPMTLAFMALLSLLVNERLFATPRRYVLWVLVTAGMAAALYWSWTESLGRGDLRPYILVQFLPVLLMPLMLAMFPARYLGNSLLLLAFALYFAAKALEHYDGQVFSAVGIISGHSIKHLAAAAAVLCIIYAVPTQSTGSRYRHGSRQHRMADQE